MWRNGPVSSSRTGSTPRTLVYHASLAARSLTVTATWGMAGVVGGMAPVGSLGLMGGGVGQPRQGARVRRVYVARCAAVRSIGRDRRPERRVTEPPPTDERAGGPRVSAWLHWRTNRAGRQRASGGE